RSGGDKRRGARDPGGRGVCPRGSGKGRRGGSPGSPGSPRLWAPAGPPVSVRKQRRDLGGPPPRRTAPSSERGTSPSRLGGRRRSPCAVCAPAIGATPGGRRLLVGTGGAGAGRP